MSAPVFFASSLEGATPGQAFEFGGADAKHVRVKRIEVGERLDLVDGEGTRALATLIDAQGETVRVQITDVIHEEPPRPRLTLIQALSKNGRDELAIEMATELGIDRVIAWEAQRSIVRWSGKKQAKSMQKWSNILRAATKQSRRARIPKLEFAPSAEAAIKLIDDDQLIVMHEAATRPISVLSKLEGPGYALVVGPEGGISDAELETFREAGAQVVLVGQTIMRVSTAVAAGLTALNIATGKV